MRIPIREIESNQNSPVFIFMMTQLAKNVGDNILTTPMVCLNNVRSFSG